MIRMPAMAEPGSVMRSRTRFQELPALPDPMVVDAAGNPGNRDRGTIEASGGEPSQGFELQEDPSFWKDHNVQVVIRIRPLSSTEVSLQGQNKCVRQDSCQTITWTGHPESRFTFDLVADEHVSQEKLFKLAGVPMVENCVAGYNSCMFAYGQTGSGKTHTMLGDIEGGIRRHSVNCGMTPRVFDFLFSRIQKEKETRRDEKLNFTCKCSFLEIYNEQILDLLDPSSANLQLREDAKKGVYVENLREIEVSSSRDVLQQLIEGAANRKVAATNMNRASSRSHSVFTCVIESKWESQGITHHRFARLNLVDLAGSERQKSSGAEGDRLKEATNINKSLSTLGLVIMNLVSSSKKSSHIPYRDSKLTFLLQDSLGGNSKTTIIANISPSNCCALETLSTLKFAQRAKFIRNNAIVNEDASGDVLTMRLQIQQLKKEVSRLRGVVNVGAENQESDGVNSASGSPAVFKWDGEQGSFSPLTIEKRLSQRKEYDAALIAAFKRDQEKEVAMKALAAEKQAAEQLASQRTDEVQGLKMRLRFREEGIKRLEAVASGKLSAETHLLQEKEELLKEIDALRNQVDRNPEVTRFAMENLRLKEELRRLQSFVEEGEREMMNEQITVLQDKLLEALDWKLMHEKDPEVAQDLSLSWDSSGNEENEFLRLQAIQNQREVEALRKNLNFCLEAKEKLERRVDELVQQIDEQRKTAEEVQLPERSNLVAPTMGELSDDQVDLKTMVDAIAAASQREAEAIILAKENEELRTKMKVLIEDNNKLIELYEVAVAEGTQKAEQTESSKDKGDFTGDGHDESIHENYYQETKDVEYLERQLHELHEENEKLMGLYENAMRERDEFKRMLSSDQSNNLVEMDEERVLHNQDGVQKLQEPGEHVELSAEKLHLVRTKLEDAQDKLFLTGEAIKFFRLLENGTSEAEMFSEKIEVLDHHVKSKHEELATLKFVLSHIDDRKTVVDNKLLALKSALDCFSSEAHCWEDREVRARAMAEACSAPLELKKEELRCIRIRKDEVNAASIKAQKSETELIHRIDQLKLKLQDAEKQKKETEKVLFSIDNLDNTDIATQRSMNFGKASELLKSEEDRTKLSAELKHLKQQLAGVQKQVLNSKKLSEELDTKVLSLELEVKNGLLSLEEAELGLQKAINDKEMLSEMREEGRSELGNMLVEYQDCIFHSDMKEFELEICQQVLNEDMRSLQELKAKRDIAVRNLKQLLEEDKRSIRLMVSDSSLLVSERVEDELRDVERSLNEVRSLFILE